MTDEMKVIALEEHCLTQRVAAELPLPPMRERSRYLGHDINEQLFDLGEDRLARMDEAGIDMQVLSLKEPGAQAFEGPDAVAIARDANDVIHAAVTAHPDRFRGFAALPTADPAAAVAEFERAVTELGFCGALINGHTGGRFLDAREFRGIFEAAEALDVPIYLHPRMVLPEMRETYFRDYRFLATASWGFAMDTGAHFLRILCSGVFDEFPSLQIILGHLGEGVPFFAHRIDSHLQPHLGALGLERSPLEYIRENLVVTCSGNFSVAAFGCAVDVLGIDRVLFSVDWPYESSTAAVAFLDALPLDPKDKASVAHANAERLLRL